MSRAKLVLAARQETSIVDELFRNAGLYEGEFLSLLQTLIDGGAIDRERIRRLPPQSRPRVRRARGPKISAASGTHELFLETNSFLRPAGRAPLERVTQAISSTRRLRPPGRNWRPWF